MEVETSDFLRALEDNNVSVEDKVFQQDIQHLPSKYGLSITEIVEHLELFQVNNSCSDITKDDIPKLERYFQKVMSSRSVNSAVKNKFLNRDSFKSQYTNAAPVTPVANRTNRRMMSSSKKQPPTNFTTPGRSTTTSSSSPYALHRGTGSSFASTWGVKIASTNAQKQPSFAPQTPNPRNLFTSPGIMLQSPAASESYKARKDRNKIATTFNDNLSMVDMHSQPASQRMDDIHLEHFDVLTSTKENRYRFMNEDVNTKSQAIKETIEELGKDLVMKIQSQVSRSKQARQNSIVSTQTGGADDHKDVEMEDNLKASQPMSQSQARAALMPRDEDDELAEEHEREKQRAAATGTTMEDTEEKTNLHNMSSSGTPIRQSSAANGAEKTAEDDLQPVRFSGCNEPSQVSCYTLGRIISDERLSKVGFTLEGDWDISLGARIQVDLSQITDCCLFPGQVVSIRGVNSSGREILANKIFTNAAMPKFQLSSDRFESLAKIGSRPLQIVVAAGPFTTASSLSFESSPFEDLAKVVCSRRPDVVLLMGPFTDRSNKLIKANDVAATFEEIFEQLLVSFVQYLKTAKVECRVLLVPSPLDSHHICSYPQPAYRINPQRSQFLSEYVQCLPNPAQFHINNLTFGVNTADFLFHCSALSAIKSSKPKETNRMRLLASHCIHQQNFYPLEPASDGIWMDYTHWSHLHMTHTPDVLIMPSQLKYFAQLIDENVLCVNPSKLAKSETGGTYALLTMHPPSTDDVARYGDMLDISEYIRADIIRI